MNQIVSNVRIYGLEESIYASGYPMMTHHDEETFNEETRKIRRYLNQMDDFKHGLLNHDPSEDEVNADAVKHCSRMMKLGTVPKGTGHDVALNGIIVQFDLTFSKQAWAEAERYNYLAFISSMSTMHKLSKMSIDDNTIEYTDPRIKAVLNELQCEYNENPTTTNFLKMIYSNPCGFLLTARMTTNYRQLKTIYDQRRTHRLPEWRAFCDWIEKLPMFKEFCLGEDK